MPCISKNVRNESFAYLKNKKISLAKHLLLNTNESIASIANDLCFYDQGYFSKTFKEVVGITPHRFRMQNIKSGGTSFEEKDRTEKINSD